MAGPQIKGRLALGMDMGRELDIADGKMTTWRFGFDDALVQGDMAVKRVIAFRAGDLDETPRISALGGRLFS